jgi:hypothetical protein
MCKLLIITGITEGLVAREFMSRMAIPMSKTNNHGIGYSAVASNGKLFSERWLNNDQFFSTANVMTKDIAKALEPYAGRLPKGALDDNYSKYGHINFEDVKSITMHTRWATCGREFVNTHPFIYKDTSLVHNGVITNAFSTKWRNGLDVNVISSCDSEAALQTYLNNEVNRDTAKAKTWLDSLDGSYAFGILSRNEQGNRVLDVVRGSSTLYFMEIDGVGKVFTTNDDDAKEVMKDMGLSFIKDKEPILIAMNEMYRYDALTGKMIQSVNIKPTYKTSGGSDSKRWGRTSGGSNTTTGTSTTSTSPSDKSSQQQESTKGNINSQQRPALLALVDTLRDEPNAMELLPDIFTTGSTIKCLSIDFRKVKLYGEDKTLPILDRLHTFDLVFNTKFGDMYESFPPSLREHVRDTDYRGTLKEARGRITTLYDEKSKTVG